MASLDTRAPKRALITRAPAYLPDPPLTDPPREAGMAMGVQCP